MAESKNADTVTIVGATIGIFFCCNFNYWFNF